MKKHIPNAITSLNLLCGALGVIAAFNGSIGAAFLMMFAASVFDFCDGLAARLLGAYSAVGKELDSLADMVSFGVLPAIMLHVTMRTCTLSSSPICLIPVVLAVFSGLRLAKFNVDTRQSESFRGLPTTAAALLAGSLCTTIATQQLPFLSVWASGFVFIPAVSAALSILLVCDLPMFSMKFGGKEADRTQRFKRICLLVNIALIIAAVLLTGHHWVMIVLLSFVVFILMNLVFAIFRI